MSPPGDQPPARQRNHRDARNILRALLAGLSLLLPSIACAELVLSAGVDYLRWVESTSPQVTETGPLAAFGLGYTQDRDAGWLFAYRGKIWGGSVNYDGATLFGGTPVESRTSYLGLTNELQTRWRKHGAPGGNIDAVLGLGLDAWRRRLSSVQKEDYLIGYARLGIETGTDESSRWTAGVGFKYPVWTYENAHFDEIGFDSNPLLHPGKEISPYVSLGYRLSSTLQLVGYYEGYRFGRSAQVQANEVNLGVGPTTLVQPATTVAVYGIRLEYLLR
jgi:hypothetical protein